MNRRLFSLLAMAGLAVKSPSMPRAYYIIAVHAPFTERSLLVITLPGYSAEFAFPESKGDRRVAGHDLLKPFLS